MITTLTNAQKEQLPIYFERWKTIGLSTKTDRVASEAAIDALYRAVGRDPPRLKIWCQSPLAAALAIAIIGRLPELFSRTIGKKEAVGSAVGSAVRSAVYSAVDLAVYSAVYSAVDLN